VDRAGARRPEVDTPTPQPWRTPNIAGSPCVCVSSASGVSTALLLVDELGFAPMTRQEASLFFRLVSYRDGRGAMLITTNKSLRDWTELLAGDEVLASAI